jgi:hypothetical protein
MGEILTSASDEAIQTTEPVWCIMCDNMPWKQSVTCSKESSAQQRVTRRGSDAIVVVVTKTLFEQWEHCGFWTLTQWRRRLMVHAGKNP